MKKIRNIFITLLVMLIVLTGSIPTFAITEENTINDNLVIDQSEMNDNQQITYGLFMNNDGQIEAIRTNSILGFPFGTEIYVGSLTVKSWIGSNVTFSIKINSKERAMSKHTGRIEFYKVKALGVGDLFNSMNFSLKDGAGTNEMSEEYTMNAQKNTKIYIKLTNLMVWDSNKEALALTPTLPQRYNKSDFS